MLQEQPKSLLVQLGAEDRVHGASVFHQRPTYSMSLSVGLCVVVCWNWIVSAHKNQQLHVYEFWEPADIMLILQIDHNGNIYMTEVSKCHKSRPPPSPESQL